MIAAADLGAIELFAGLDESDLDQIAADGADIRLNTGEWLTREGELPAFYVLLSGRAEVTKYVQGVEHVLNHYDPGDFFGEVPLLLGSTVVANLRATEDMRVMRLDESAFHALMNRCSGIAASITQKMTKRVQLLRQLSRAMFFVNYARTVTLLIRASTIEKGMSAYLIGQLATKTNVAVRLDSRVVSVEGGNRLEALEIENAATKTRERVETPALFVFIGADAETSWLPNEIAKDERGYLLTGYDVRSTAAWPLDRDPLLLETSVPGIFAAGDVRAKSVKRVASGVGEGSMAIAFIHEFLAQKAVAAAV